MSLFLLKSHAFRLKLAVFACGVMVLAPQLRADPGPEGPFFGLSGYWSGSGTITMSNGAAERIRCRATYAVNGAGRALQQTLRCASDSYRLDISSNVVSEGGALSGSWSEATRGVSGSISGSPAVRRLWPMSLGPDSQPGSTCAPRATDSRCRSGHPAAQMYRPCRSLCIKDRGLQGSLPLGRSSALAPCRGAAGYPV